MRPARIAAADRQPLTLSVDLPEEPTPALLSAVLASLLKSLLHQRRQIPVQFELLERDLASASKDASDSGEEDEDRRADDRSRIKKRKAALKSRKLRERYLSRAESFHRDFRKLLSILREEIGTRRVSRVTFLFGATPMSPRETYHVALPRLSGRSCAEEDSLPSHRSVHRVGLSLFRKLVTNEALFKRLGAPMTLTNVFVSIKRRPNFRSYQSRHSEYLVARPELSRLTASRGKTTYFNLNYKYSDKSGFVVEEPESGSLVDSLLSSSPVPMDLCSPFVGERTGTIPTPRNHSHHAHDRSVDAMIETPCVSSRGIALFSASPPSSESRSYAKEESLPQMMEELILEENEEKCPGPFEGIADAEDDDECLWFLSSVKFRGFDDPRMRFQPH